MAVMGPALRVERDDIVNSKNDHKDSQYYRTTEAAITFGLSLTEDNHFDAPFYPHNTLLQKEI